MSGAAEVSTLPLCSPPAKTPTLIPLVFSFPSSPKTQPYDAHSDSVVPECLVATLLRLLYLHSSSPASMTRSSSLSKVVH
jgi:hypothetical protein